MSKVLVDRDLLAKHVAEIDSWNASMERILGKQPSYKWQSLESLRAILAQPAETEGVVPVAGYLVDVPDEPELGHWYEEEAEEEGEDLGPPLTRCQPLVRQADHLAALSAVTAERDRLADMMGGEVETNVELREQCHQLRAEVEALRKDAERLDWLDGYIVIAEHEDTGKFALNSIKGALRECIDAALAAKEA